MDIEKIFIENYIKAMSDYCTSAPGCPFKPEGPRWPIAPCKMKIGQVELEWRLSEDILRK